jgi:hypothetical protein
MRVTVNKRRSLTPNSGMPAVPNGRLVRRSDVRRTVSDRVTFRSEAGPERQGWALNVSSGGLRAILDQEPHEPKVELGEEYLIWVGTSDGSGTARRGRIVWLQEEPDGFVVGMEYLSPSGLSGMHPVATPVPPEASPVLASDASGISPAVTPADGISAAGAGIEETPPSQD